MAQGPAALQPAPASPLQAPASATTATRELTAVSVPRATCGEHFILYSRLWGCWGAYPPQSPPFTHAALSCACTVGAPCLHGQLLRACQLHAPICLLLLLLSWQPGTLHLCIRFTDRVATAAGPAASAPGMSRQTSRCWMPSPPMRACLWPWPLWPASASSPSSSSSSQSPSTGRCARGCSAWSASNGVFYLENSSCQTDEVPQLAVINCISLWSWHGRS